MKEKMMPGQRAYTEEKREQLDDLLRGAADALDCFDEDELEEWAHRRKEDENAGD